jgi:hypothetical protein
MLDKLARLVIVLAASASLSLVACGKKDEETKEAPKAAEPAAAQPTPATPSGPQIKRTMAMDPMKTAPAANAGDPAAADDGTPPSGILPKLDELQKKACACKDETCANGIQNDLAAMMGEMKEPQKNEQQKIGETMQAIQKCIAAAQGG